MLPRLADALIVHAFWTIVLGFALCGTERAFGVGGMTGVVMVSLGASCGCLRLWRTEPGLWMPSAPFLTLFGAPWILLGTWTLMDLHGPARLDAIHRRIDFALALSLLALMVVFLATVTSVNCRLGDKREGPVIDEC